MKFLAMHRKKNACVSLLALPMLLFTLSGCTQGLLITQVNVIDVDRGLVVERQDVLIADGVISSVLPSQASKKHGVQVVDGDGKYIVPGFWDMHVHFRTRKFIGESLNNEAVAENEALLPLFLKHGITSVFDMGTDIPQHLLQWRSEITLGQRVGPRLMLTGPKIEGAGAEFAGSFEIVSTQDVDRVLANAMAANLPGITVMALWIDPNVQQYLVDESERLGLKTFVHALETFRATSLSDSGFSAIAHMDNILPEAGTDFAKVSKEVNSRKEPTEAPGDWYWGIAPRFFQDIDPQLLRDLLDTLASNGTAVISTFNGSRLAVHRAKIPEEVLTPLSEVGHYFSASVRGRYERVLGREVSEWDRNLFEGNVELSLLIAQSDVLFLIGTDSGLGNVAPGISFHNELGALQEAGLTPQYLLRAATMNPAVFMGTEQSEGTVSAGKRADLVLLNSNPLEDIRNCQDIHAVIRDGQLIEFDNL